MKAIKHLLLSLLGVLMALPGIAADFTFTSGGVTLTYTTLTDASCAVKAGQTTTATTIVVPAQAGGYAVTEIAADAFKGRTTLQSITLAPTITTIGSSAFSGCTALSKVYLGPAVTTIGASAFASDTALTDIYITAQMPPTIQSTTFPAQSAFKTTPTLHTEGTTAQAAYTAAAHWSNFTSKALMTAPTSMTATNGINYYTGNTVYAQAGKTGTGQFSLYPGKTVKFSTTLYPTVDLSTIFWTSSDPTKVSVSSDGTISMSSLPSENVLVRGFSIYSNSPIIQVTIYPAIAYTYEGTTLYYRIESGATNKCAVVDAPDNTAHAPIPENAILKGISYPVTSIAECAFFKKTALKTVSIPNSVTSVSHRAFYQSGLTKVDIPTSVTEIRTGAFQGSALSSIVIPNSVVTLGSHIFNGCQSLESATLGSGITSIPGSTFINCKELKSIVLPPSVTEIGSNAFAGTQLTKVYIGPKVTTIGAGAFNAYDSETKQATLTDVYITAQTPPALDATAFPADMYAGATLHVQGDPTMEVYSGTEYWKDFSKKMPMTAPDNIWAVNGINKYNGNSIRAYLGETASGEFSLPQGGSVTYTANFEPTGNEQTRMFWTSEDYSTVPVDTEGKITMTTLPANDVKITGISIYDNTPVIEVVIHPALAYTHEDVTLLYRIVSESAKTCYLTGYQGTVTHAPIPEKVTLNGKEYTVTALGECAFFQNKNLKTVSIPGSVETISHRVFYGSGLTEVEIPASVTEIRTGAFQNSDLTSVVVPNSVTKVGTHIFSGCRSLTSATLGSGLTTITGNMFATCPLLTSIVLPPSVTEIAVNAFAGTQLKNVYMGPKVATIGAGAFNAYDPTYKQSTLTDVYITAQTPPALDATAFHKDMYAGATLHVQGEALAQYDATELWKDFSVRENEVMAAPTGLSVVNGINKYVGNTISAVLGEKASGEFSLTEGGTVTYSAIFNPTETELQRMFWTSEDYSTVPVDTDGKITMTSLPANDVQITGISIYDNTPIIEVVIHPALAYTHEDVTLLYRIVSESAKTCYLTGYQGTVTHAPIPEKVTLNGKEYTVTALGECAFFQNKDLKTVSIPGSVNTISHRVFYGSGLTEVEIPASVTEIRTGAFQNSDLTSVVVPNSVTKVGTHIFSGCRSLTSATLGSALTTITGNMFTTCPLLTSIVIPPSVTEIAVNAFAGTQLKKAYMGPKVASIGAGAFNAYDSETKQSTLTDVYITAQTPPALDATAFHKDMYAVASLHVQGEGALSLYSDSEYWKEFSNKEKDVMKAPDNIAAVNGINKYSSNSIRAYAGETASGEFSLAEGGSVTYTVTFEPTGIEQTRMFWTSEDYSTVPVDTEGKITMTTLPANDVKITGISIYDNTPIIEVVIHPALAYTHEDVTLLYRIVSESAKTCYLTGYQGTVTHAPIPEKVTLNGKEYTVTALGECAFFQNKDLKTVSIPGSVETISHRVFYGSGLTEVEIPASVTEIRTGAFQNSDLTSVVVPNSVTKVGTHIFSGCRSLESATLGSGLTTITGNMFTTCPLLTSIVIPPSVTEIAVNAFAGTQLKKAYMGPKVASIGAGAFNAYDSETKQATLTDVYITAQTPPALDATAFPAAVKSGATLHVQGGKTLQDAYKNGWSFTKEVQMTKPHVEMKLAMGGSQRAVNAPVRRKADVVTTTEEHIYGLTGQTHQRTATLVGENGEAVEIPNVFWSSDNTQKVYVDHNGTININEAPELRKPVTVTAQSLYADAPTRTVTVDHEMMTSVEEIVFDEEGLDITTGHIFTTDGVYVGESVKALSPGVYILRQNDKAYKIYIK